MANGDDLRQQLSEGLGQALGGLGTAAVGAVAGGSPEFQGAFAQGGQNALEQHRQRSIQMEQEREARRQRNLAMVQNLAMSNPNIFHSLPQTAKDTLLNAVGEPYAELNQLPIDDPQVRQFAEGAITAPQPTSPETGLKIAKAGAEFGSQDLFRMGISAIDPELGATIQLPDGGFDVDPTILNKLLGDTDSMTLASRQDFLESMQAGDPDFNLLKFDEEKLTAAGSSLPDFLNARAHEAWAKMQRIKQGSGETMNAVDIRAVRSKMKDLDDGRLSKQDKMRLMLNGMTQVIALQVVMGGGLKDVDRAVETVEDTITKMLDSLEGVDVPLNAEVLEPLTGATLERIMKLENPDSFDAEMRAMRDELKSTEPDLTDEQIIDKLDAQLVRLTGG